MNVEALKRVARGYDPYLHEQVRAICVPTTAVRARVVRRRSPYERLELPRSSLYNK